MSFASSIKKIQDNNRSYSSPSHLRSRWSLPRRNNSNPSPVRSSWSPRRNSSNASWRNNTNNSAQQVHSAPVRTPLKQSSSQNDVDQLIRTSSTNQISSRDGLRNGNVNPPLNQSGNDAHHHINEVLPAVRRNPSANCYHPQDRPDQISFVDYSTLWSKYQQVLQLLVDLQHQQSNNYIPSLPFSNHEVLAGTHHVRILGSKSTNDLCPHCKRPFSPLAISTAPQNYNAQIETGSRSVIFEQPKMVREEIPPITNYINSQPQDQTSILPKPQVGSKDVEEKAKFKDILIKNLPPQALIHLEEKKKEEDQVKEKMVEDQIDDGDWETVKSKKEKKKSLEEAQGKNSQTYRHRGYGRDKYKSKHQNKHMKN